MSWLEGLEIDGVEVTRWRTIAGLGSPAPRSDTRDRAQRDGAVDYTAFYTPRLLEVTGILSGDPSTIWPALDDLKMRFALGTVHVLRFKRAGIPEWERVTGKVAAPFKADTDYETPNSMPWDVAFLASDPRIYADTLSDGSYAPGSTGAGGLKFPLSFPLTFSTSGDSAQLEAENDGTFRTPPIWTVTGPVTNPQVANQTTGENIVTEGVSLAAGEVMVIDVAAREVTIDGATRLDVIDAANTTWGELAPGVNVIELLGDSIDAGAGTLLAVEFRSARI